MRIIHNVANVGGFVAVLGDDPELPPYESVANGDTARLPGLAADGFEDRSSWNGHADSKQKLDGWIEQVFLKHVDDAVLHRIVFSTAELCLALAVQLPGSIRG